MSYQQSLLGVTTAALGFGYGASKIPGLQEKFKESIAKKKIEMEDKLWEENQKDIQNWEKEHPG